VGQAVIKTRVGVSAERIQAGVVEAVDQLIRFGQLGLIGASRAADDCVQQPGPQGSVLIMGDQPCW
jgi:hypothetical protein